MSALRKYIYAALFAFSSLSFAPALMSAQEAARGKFTLPHDVHWQNAVVPAGDYRFSFQADGSKVLWLSKMSDPRTSYMFLVRDQDETKATGRSRIMLENTPAGSYVSAMQLPQFGMTLRFPIPSTKTEKQVARASTASLAFGPIVSP